MAGCENAYVPSSLQKKETHAWSAGADSIQQSTLTLPRAGTTLQPMTQRSLSNSTLAEAPNKESLARSPGSAQTLSRRTPTIKGAQRPRSGSGGTAPEGVGGATGGNVLPAGS